MPPASTTAPEESAAPVRTSSSPYRSAQQAGLLVHQLQKRPADVPQADQRHADLRHRYS